MTALLQAATSVLNEIEVEFPNLFGGVAISYYRGFMLFGKLPIYWYGVIITLGVILAYFYAMHRTKDFGLNKDRVFDVVFAALIGGFLGARIYYCVFTTLDPNSGIKYDLVTTFTTIRDGGLAIYGGIIGGFLVGFIACKIRKVHFFAMTDIAVLGILIGQTLGRWGNFINQEAYGAVCPQDWVFGMSGDIISKEIEAGQLVHPCFLYESAWCLLGFVLLHFYSKKLRSFDGEVTLLYVAWYGFGRFFIEGLRTDSLMAGGFKASQLLAGISFVVALVLFIVFKVYTSQKNIPLYVNTEACKEQLRADKDREDAEKAKAAAKKAAKETAPSILADEFTYEEETEQAEDEAENTAEEATDESEEPSPEDTLEDNSDEADASSYEEIMDNDSEETEKLPENSPENNDSKSED